MFQIKISMQLLYSYWLEKSLYKWKMLEILYWLLRNMQSVSSWFYDPFISTKYLFSQVFQKRIMFKEIFYYGVCKKICIHGKRKLILRSFEVSREIHMPTHGILLKTYSP